MAEKSLVKAVAEMVGVDDELDELGVVLFFVLVVFDELPHAAAPNIAVTASAARTALLFSKCTITSLSFLGTTTSAGANRVRWCHCNDSSRPH
jgi:hypothetical protein